MQSSNNTQSQNFNLRSYPLNNFAKFAQSSPRSTPYTSANGELLNGAYSAGDGNNDSIIPFNKCKFPSPQVPKLEENPPRIQDHVMDPIFLTEEYLTLTYLENAEERILMQTPPNIRKVSLNIRSCAWSPIQQYMVNLCSVATKNLDFTLGQGENSTNTLQINILLWNCRWKQSNIPA